MMETEWVSSYWIIIIITVIIIILLITSFFWSSAVQLWDAFDQCTRLQKLVVSLYFCISWKMLKKKNSTVKIALTADDW